MVNKNTDAQVKAQIISIIQIHRESAIELGFDYPTIEPSAEDYSAAELLEFLEEIIEYVRYNEGYEDGFEAAISGEEIQLQTTH